MLKPSLIQGPLHSEESLECSNGIFKSEGSGGFLLLQKDIPNLYPKLLHPVQTGSKNRLGPLSIIGYVRSISNIKSKHFKH